METNLNQIDTSEIVQGTVVIFYDRYPKIIKYEDMTVEASYNDYLLYEKKRRPAIVLSTSADGYKNHLVIPMTGKENNYAKTVELEDWNRDHLYQRSWAKMYDVKLINESNILKVLGQLTERDLAIVLHHFHKMI